MPQPDIDLTAAITAVVRETVLGVVQTWRPPEIIVQEITDRRKYLTVLGALEYMGLTS